MDASASPLASRCVIFDMEWQKNSIKPYPDLFIKINLGSIRISTVRRTTSVEQLAR